MKICNYNFIIYKKWNQKENKFYIIYKKFLGYNNTSNLAIDIGIIWKKILVIFLKMELISKSILICQKIVNCIDINILLHYL